MLSWIVCAKRPVKTIEVQYAWAVRDCEGRIEEAAVPDVEDMLLACCELVVVDKESDIIRLVHCTAQEYFQDTLTRWFPDGHSNIANTCVSYLSFNDFSGGPVKTREEAYERLEKPLFSYAVDHWGHHISACPSSTFRLIDRLKDPEWVSMVVQLSAIFSEIRKYPWLSSPDLRPSQNAFHIVGVYGLNDFVELLLVHAKDIDPDRQDKAGRTPLSWAAEYGQTEVVRTLLCDGRVDPERQDNEGQTPLSWAAKNGQTEVCNALLCDGHVDPDRQDKAGRTPLSWAAEYGHTEVVKTLLCNGRVDPDRQGDDGRTPLSWAAENGHLEVVKTLLSDGRVDPRRQDNLGRTPLDYAESLGHTEIVRALTSNSWVCQ